MKSSVVICVYTEDRWEDIREAVESVERQRRPAHELILVVDYNPDLLLRLKDAYARTVSAGARRERATEEPTSGEAGATKSTVSAGARRERATEEPTSGQAGATTIRVVENVHDKGLSGGKNTGADVATGDIVAYLDDDAVADAGWLEALEEGFQDPAVVGVGGRTDPLWKTGGRPGWFPYEFDWTVGCSYRGMPAVRSPIRNVMGGNAAFRREAVGEVGGFHSGIGRSVQGRKSRPLGCEETEFCIRLSQRKPGSVMLFEPDAVIGHKVPAQRATFAYFRSRCYAEGLSKALVTQSVGTQDGLKSERAHALKALPLGALRGLGEAVRGDVSGIGRAFAIVIGLAWTTWGYVVGSARLKVVRK